MNEYDRENLEIVLLAMALSALVAKYAIFVVVSMVLRYSWHLWQFL